MKIQVLSDLHLEFGVDFTVENAGADVLVLAGDICTAVRPDLSRPFFERCSRDFKHVVYIAGNHEYYHNDIELTHNNIQETLTGLDNIQYLNEDITVIDGVVFFGGTLWTDCNRDLKDIFYKSLQDIRHGLNDYRLITVNKLFKKLDPADTIKIHDQTLNKLIDLINTCNKKVIVVSHHAPSRKSLSPVYQNDVFLNGAYQSDLEWIMKDYSNICLWTHGHCHDSFDYSVNKTRVICNAAGYPNRYKSARQNQSFNPRLVIEI